MFRLIGLLVVVLILLGIGSCVYNVHRAAKGEYVTHIITDNQKLIVHTDDGDFGFDFKKVKSIEIVR